MTKASGRSRRASPARRASLKILLALEAGSNADDLLAAYAPQDGADRAQTWHIVKGVLRHRLELDDAINQLSKRSCARLDPVPLAVLRIGVFEHRYSRTPAHAVVSQAVDLCKTSGARHSSGLINAVLRKIPKLDPPAHRITLSHPEWLLKRWEERLGRDPAQLWAEKNNTDARTAVVLRGPAPAGLELEQARAFGAPVPGVFYVNRSGSVAELPGFSDGSWWVQDPAAAAVADLVSIKPGDRVLDACAAPGGKSFRLVAKGAKVFATDRSASRLELMAQGLKRLELDLELLQWDWTLGQPELPLMDAIIVDAPCSGLGTIRRHPEIRWRRSAKDLIQNAILQLEILKSCSKLLRPGGQLVYAVCSGEPEEGSQVVEAFLREEPGYSLQASISSAPPQDEEDSFQAAKLIKVG